MRNQENADVPENDLSFGELLEKEFARDEVKEGEIISAVVLSVNKDFVLVDVGYKSEGLIPAGEFPQINGEPQVKVGDRVEVLVETRENEFGHMVLSKEKADRLKVWDEISAACERDEVVEGTIIGRVKGGLQVDIGVRAFLPGSQVDLRPIRNLEKLIGERFKFSVIKFNKKRGNIVLSRRALLEKDREERRKVTLQHLKEGAVMEGVVKNLTDYGAFVDLGGVDGLLHVTDMSWGRVQNPNGLFEVGQTVKVVVLKYDQENERVSLGMKQTQEDPWQMAQKDFPVGSRVNGKVVSLTDYGAFIELKPGVEGLIHVSEMSWTKRVKHPSKIVNIGDEVEALVLDIDQENKRISLGMNPSGKTYDAPVSSLDVFATSLALADVPMPTDRVYDGVNLLPFLTGTSKGDPHNILFWRMGGGTYSGARESGSKLIRRSNRADQLYHLSEDIGEKNDLSVTHATEAKELSAKVDEWNKTLVPPGFRGLAGRKEP